jgi:hypothetical protein
MNKLKRFLKPLFNIEILVLIVFLSVPMWFVGKYFSLARELIYWSGFMLGMLYYAYCAGRYENKRLIKEFEDFVERSNKEREKRLNDFVKEMEMKGFDVRGD